MSEHNGKLSRSERTILALQQKLAEFETMRTEYNLLLNILVHQHGGRYIMHSEDAKKVVPPKGIRSETRFATEAEIAEGVPSGKLMIFTLVEPPEQPKLVTLG